MTLKYESELLFDLMKRDGDDAPSDVLPYESELKEKYLNQVTGAYPKLQDYQPEWLNYNLYHHLPSDFPVESVANVTSASFNNVVPYAYKSAILKGQTLVNLIGEKHEYNTVNAKTLYGWEFMLPYNLTSGKTYLAIFDVSGTIDESNSKVYLMDNDFESSTGNTTSTVPTFSLGHNVVKCIATNDIHKVLRIRTTYNENEKFTVSNVMLIEYQDGMENWDISYFEGMQSVKMPVLTTTGKNLFDGKIVGNYFVDGEGTLIPDSECYATDYIKINPNTQYTVNNPKNEITGFYDKDKIFITWTNSNTFLSPQNAEFLRTTIKPLSLLDTFQLEEGAIATSYEPYKSNILTTPEDLELRGIGDVQDTLDCLTGEVTERVGEVILNGSENWTLNTINDTAINLYCDGFGSKPSSLVMCDKLKSERHNGIRTSTIGGFTVTLDRNITGIDDINTFKNWLQNNNLTVAYPLETEVIKTVDLTVTNQDEESESTIRPIEGTMHVSTSSQTLPPLLDMIVPVEATSQNLMSFANIVEEE